MLFSPVQLNDVVFVSSTVEARIPDEALTYPFVAARGLELAGRQLEVALAVGTPQEDPPEHWLVRLGISLGHDGDDFPYLIRVVVAGLVVVHPGFEKDKPKVRSNCAVVNGAGLLYGVVRDHIATQTLRSAFGRVWLPTANFSDYAEADEDHPDRKQAVPFDIKETSPLLSSGAVVSEN